MDGLGPRLVKVHMAEMTALSGREWPAIEERPGYTIVQDRAYQGFDNDPSCSHPHAFCGHFPEWYPEPRFWCRNIIVRRDSDGRDGWGIGPQADAYAMAIEAIER